MNNKETKIIDPSEDEVLDFTYSITSYGADYPVDSLVKRLRENKIKIPPFQRRFVWGEEKASRFIESLLLGLPVPGIFLSKDLDSADLLVIDGLQRLKSLLFFYNGFIDGKPFKLKDVQNRFDGKTYKDLESDDRQRLDDSIIHATIVKQDQPSEDNSSIYLIFERLNTGGMILQPQEIRSAIYSGTFLKLLQNLNENPSWREIYGNPSSRLKDQEFILRFFALYFYRTNYKKPLKGFLNSYMAKNKNLVFNNEKELTTIFETTVTFVAKNLGNNAFRPKHGINASVFDSMMVGIATMLSTQKDVEDIQYFLEKYNRLLNDKEYVFVTTRGTSDEPTVERRINMAIAAFSKTK